MDQALEYPKTSTTDQYYQKMFDWMAPQYLRDARKLSWGRYDEWMDSLAALISQSKPSNLVDIGCGPGLLLSKLAMANPNMTLVGIDLSEKALALIPQTLRIRTEPLALQDFARREPQQYDEAVATFVIRDVRDRSAFLADVHRLLRPNGQLWILETHTPTGFKGIGFRMYFEQLMPRWGRQLTRQWPQNEGPWPFDWLASTHREWNRGEALSELLRESGFKNLRSYFPASEVVLLVSANKA